MTRTARLIHFQQRSHVIVDHLRARDINTEASQTVSLTRPAILPQTPPLLGFFSHCPLPRLPTMKGQVVAPRLQWQEITRSLAVTSEELLGKLSVGNILSHSWEAGGVYPTLLGYALGAIATAALLGASNWALRFTPPVICAIVFVQTLLTMQNPAFAVLLAFAAFIGVGCTYVQVLSWQEAFASVAQRRKMKKKPKSSKVDKED